MKHLLNTLEDYRTLLSFALVAGCAAAVRQLRDGATWKEAMIEGAVAFVLGGAAGSFLIYYSGLPPYVVCGFCALIGMVSTQVLLQIEKFVNAAGLAARNRIKK